MRSTRVVSTLAALLVAAPLLASAQSVMGNPYGSGSGNTYKGNYYGGNSGYSSASASASSYGMYGSSEQISYTTPPHYPQHWCNGYYSYSPCPVQQYQYYYPTTYYYYPTTYYYPIYDYWTPYWGGYGYNFNFNYSF